MIDAALAYAARGWRVLPLVPRDKTPLIPGCFKNATTDAATIRAWWKSEPNANIGIRCGDGLTVIDVDDKPEKHGGILGSDVLREWELENGDIAPTVTAISGTGGTHYYYDTTGDEFSKCESKKLSIDLRGEGSYIVAPPSIHPETGEPYLWDVSPDDMEPARAGAIEKACIEWVYENRDGAENESEPFTAPDIVHEGEGRDKILYKMACSMRAHCYPESTILAALRDYNAAHCVPPMPDKVVKQKVKSAMKHEPGTGGEKKQAAKGKSGKFPHAQIARTLIEEKGACFIDGMPAIRHGDRYSIGWNEIIREIINLKDDSTRANQKEVVNYLTIMAPYHRQSPPNLIAFNNGILDINTMELREWQEDDIIPNVIPHDWNEGASYPEVDAVLQKMACGDMSIVYSLFEVMGMCMYRSAEFTQSAILLGSGANGKSTFIRMLQALLGRENISSLDLGMLNMQFHTKQLAGKLANLGDDISNEFKNGDKLTAFKKIVDGNIIFADVKGVDGFDFEPYCTMVFSANEFPELADYTDGMMRRLFAIEFNAKFSKSDPDYDPRIARKVTSEEACEYMCKLGVAGLARIMDANGFTPTAASARRVNEIRANSDAVLAWIVDESISSDALEGAVIANKYQDFRIWCEKSGLQPIKRTKFTRGITSHVGLVPVVAWRDGKSARIFAKA